MQNQWSRYAMVGLGSIIAGIGINAFWVPHHLLSGGVSGIAMILFFMFKWPLGLMIALFNMPLFALAYRYLNKDYFFVSLYGMLIFSAAIDATSFVANLNIVDDTMLAAIYGGVIAGIGSGMTYRVNGGAGGTDIVGAILKKYYSLSISTVGFAINCIVMVVAAALFGAKLAMYTLLSMYVVAAVTDKVIEGFNRKKTIIIISEVNDQIAAAILKEVGRGVTFLHGKGAFTRQEKEVIFVVVKLTQIAKIKFIVEKVDAHAFMIVQDAAEVLGKGFTQ
jgi:uncharacterized membrane-anchored protein YitT (DUF2179 family)